MQQREEHCHLKLSKKIAEGPQRTPYTRFSSLEKTRPFSIEPNLSLQPTCTNLNTTPTTAPPKTNHAELTLNRNKSTAAIPAIKIAGTLNSASRANCHPTNAINATAAAFTPSRNAPAVGDFLNRGKNFAVTPTNTNAGKNIPTVASAAPFHPASTYPMNVDTVKNGPGVPWLTAIASINWLSVSQCSRSTRSARSTANKT